MTVKKYIDLASYDRAVLSNNMHSQILKFADLLYPEAPNGVVGAVLIEGCEIPVYFLILDTNDITFACKSKVMRAYIFTLLVNLAFAELDSIANFDFDKFVEKYDLENNLTPARLESLQGIVAALSTMSSAELQVVTLLQGYTFMAELL